MKKQEKNPERMRKVKPLTNKYKWEGINFPSEKNDWRGFEKNNVTIALNVLYAKKGKLYPAYVVKHNSDCEKQVILLMIPDGKGREATSRGPWHYIAVVKLSALV